MPATRLELTSDQCRALRILAQGLPPAPKAQAPATVAQSGFVRTLGGADAYLGVRARVPSLRRADLDAAVDRGEVQVSPAARGCMYLVARRDAPLCLRFAERLSAARDERDQAKAGIRKGEVEAVAKAALVVLKATGPLTTDALRKAMPEGSVRSLGERGKKVGVSSPLPAALRRLEFEGRIARTPEGGRVDTERYQWRAVAGKTAAGGLPDDGPRLHARMLERFVAFAGVATLKDFCAWSGLSQRDVRAALDHADLLPAAVDGIDDAFAHRDAARLLARADEAEDAVGLLPFEDNLVHLGGGPRDFVDEAFHALPVPAWSGGGAAKPLGEADHLPFRGVLADGRLCGFWEYDPDRRTVGTYCFQTPGKAAQRRIDELAAATGAFLRDELGHGHSFSLDTDDELRKRIALLQELGGGRRKAKVVQPAKPAPRPRRAARTGEARVPAPRRRSRAR